MARDQRVGYVYNYLLRKGLSPVAAAGVTGHLIEESGFFAPDVVAGKRRGDQGTAGYVAQWRGPRLRGLYEFARSQGREVNLDTQLDYIFHEAQSGSDQGAQRALSALQTARTPQEAVAAFAHFERPAGYTSRNPYGIQTFGKRLSHTNNVLRMFGGQQGQQEQGVQAASLDQLGYGPAASLEGGAYGTQQGGGRAEFTPMATSSFSTPKAAQRAYGAFANDPYLEGKY